MRIKLKNKILKYLIFISFGGIILTAVTPYKIIAVPVLLIVTAAAAKIVSDKLVSPFNDFEAGNFYSLYDELAPLLRTISTQRERIASQYDDLIKRSDTTNMIMDSMQEGIVLLNGNGIILAANKSILKIFNLDNIIKDKNILELFRDMELITHTRTALNGEKSELYYNNSGRVYQILFNPIATGGAIILFLDITERAKSEKIRKEFTANVSHELKTPLTNISGYAEMIMEDLTTKEEDIKYFAGKIKDESARLITLVKDIIMLSELDEKALRTLEQVDLIDLINEVRESFGFTISVTAEDATVKGNRSMLYEMFFNLIDNAVKYNVPNGRVDIKIFNAENNFVNIIISDTGIGIPKEAQARLFERFYRVDKSRSKKTGGTGLGLSIVKHIVLVHGGTVEITSKENVGTTVNVRLPKFQ